MQTKSWEQIDYHFTPKQKHEIRTSLTGLWCALAHAYQ